MKDKSSEEKIHEALSLLNEAAKEKKGEVGKIIQERYSAIKDVLSKNAARTTENIKDREEQVERGMQEHPWSLVTGVAIVSLLLGFIMGGSKPNR